MKASSLSFQAAILIVLAGMVWGLQMAISNDHSAFPAHAHLNLLGFVSLFLFGFYYRMYPSLDQSRAAFAQVSMWIAGTVVMAGGVGLVAWGDCGWGVYVDFLCILVILVLLIISDG